MCGNLLFIKNMSIETQNKERYVDNRLGLFERYQNRALELVWAVDGLKSCPWEIAQLTDLGNGLQMREVAMVLGRAIVERKLFEIEGEGHGNQVVEIDGEEWRLSAPFVGRAGNFEYMKMESMGIAVNMEKSGRKMHVELECSNDERIGGAPKYDFHDSMILRVSDGRNVWRLSIYQGRNVNLSHEWEEREKTGRVWRESRVRESWSTPMAERVSVGLSYNYDGFLG